MQYRIYNFDHNFNGVPCEFQIGTFKVIIQKQHSDNLTQIPRGEKTHFQTTYSGPEPTKTVNTTEAVPGECNSWYETAIVKCDDLITESRLYAKEAQKTSLDDLCLLFSFLTGRRVSPEYDRQNFIAHKYYSSRIVSISPKILNDAWNNIDKLVQENLVLQFYNLVLSYTEYDALGLFTYANSSLNLIFDRWAKGQNYSTFDKQTKDIIQEAENKAKEAAVKYLQEKLDTTGNRKHRDFFEKVQKVVVSLGEKSPSAVVKQEEFFIHFGFAPDSKDARKRIGFLNRIRNAFVHRGELFDDKEFSREQQIRIAVFFCLVTVKIVQVYITEHILSIGDSVTKEIKRSNIFSFFNTGTYMGQQIESEDFKAYMQRVEKAFLEEDWHQNLYGTIN